MKVPNFKNPTFDDVVDVFEDRMKGWMLDWAEHLNDKNFEHSGFAVLHIGISYFEAIAIFIKGENSKGKSSSFFKFGFRDVFKNYIKEWSGSKIKQVEKLMYENGRCGFYHTGMAKKEIGLQNGELFTVIEEKENSENVDSVRINRYKFIAGIRKHFEGYISQLRDSQETELRKCFINGWDIFHKN